ncbi:DNA cytosine methyltransferase [Rhodopseudomonas sp. RCAM05734]|uniref:DNA cytosine methyltransferase n=1 Tax=Rhodopseudomonas sp. RCAM05734 TaxID=3457549 RepID=UPI004043CABA
MKKTPVKPLTFIDAFAGCGGLSLGLMQAGCKGLFAIEHDQFAFETLKANLLGKDSRYKFAWPKWLAKEPIGINKLLTGHAAQLRDLHGKVDVLVGGPPCQGFSSAGRRKHDDPRNQLFASYLKLVNSIKPRAVVIENVRGFTMDFENGDNYSAKLRKALSADYQIHEAMLDLSQFGVPQRRVRYVLLAIAKDTVIDRPFETLKARLPSFLRSLGIAAPVSSRAAISDLEIARNGTKDSTDTQGFQETRYRAPLTTYQKAMHGGHSAMTDLRLARHSDPIAARFKEIIELSHAEGRLNTTLSEDVRARFGLKKRALRVLDPDKPSPTITSLPDDLIHYSEPRTLTVRENARLQSFPDWFCFKGKYTTGGYLRRIEVPRFTQVANAVPPLLARAIGELLQEILAPKPKRAASSLRLKDPKQSPEFRAHV